ncbi:hypothetical protein HBA_0686 [Sodalis endosymbiont of Henestaris halophilus]|nr:hypothetical protein HBA_0686 [Sodalis endosymbiont of Henestaris halophilus]
MWICMQNVKECKKLSATLVTKSFYQIFTSLSNGIKEGNEQILPS